MSKYQFFLTGTVLIFYYIGKQKVERSRIVTKMYESVQYSKVLIWYTEEYFSGKKSLNSFVYDFLHFKLS